MAGCLKGALDLPDQDRNKNLHYSADLLQDASDLSFEGAKACHAVVLTTMEHDKVSWQDTSNLDCFRRQHAQVHVKSTPTVTNVKSKRPAMANKQEMMPCKFFNDGYCSNQDSRITRGVHYLHICTRCKGDHAFSARKCKPKN